MNIMGRILGNLRIPFAVLISAVLIVGAFVLARGVGSPPGVQASAESALLEAIASRDSDADGLPDWEEALYGTDPKVADSHRLGMSDGEAVAKGLIVPKALADIPFATSSPSSTRVNSALPPAPGENTLTAAFSRDFLSAYLAAKQAKGGTALSQTDIDAVANQVLESLAQSVASAPDFKTLKDLTVSGSGPESLREFAINVEAVLEANTGNAVSSEINYLKYAMVSDYDPRALAALESIAGTYRRTALGIAALPVPQELVATDLALVNALMRVSEIASDFARVNTDPLATMLALYQYPQAISDLGTAFISVASVYRTAGLSFPDGTPGASFVNLIAEIAASQEAANTP